MISHSERMRGVRDVAICIRNNLLGCIVLLWMSAALAVTAVIAPATESLS